MYFLIYSPFSQETSFGGGQAVVTRKVSTTSMPLKGSQAQVVTVTRSASELNKANARTVNGASHGKTPSLGGQDISPWQVTPVITDVPQQQPIRRVHLTTEL